MTGKRRKIKCLYESRDRLICVGCLDKNTTCRSQEYVEDQPQRDAGNSALDQRMGRVEMLLEQIVGKASQATEKERHPYDPANFLSPSSMPATTYESQPASASFLNNTIGQQAVSNSSITPLQGVSISDSNQRASASKESLIGRTEKLRRQLAAMLPCQEDIDSLSELSQGWWFVQHIVTPHLLGQPDHDLLKPFDVLAVSESHLMIIARLLLCVALCIQQLSSDVDLRRFRTKVPLDVLMENIITIVPTAVTSDDDLIGNLEGVDCLLLQGIYHFDAGNLRRAWLTLRRAINVAQLMGLHRVSLKGSEDGQEFLEVRRKSLWYQIVKGVRNPKYFARMHTDSH
jgi:hypothetical protein